MTPALLRRSALLLPVVAATAASVAGCTSSGSGGGDKNAPLAGSASTAPGSAAPSSSAPSSSARSTPITQPKSVPASVPNSTGAISGRLVALTGCSATKDGWHAEGTAKGKGGKKAKYTVTVFFTTNAATVEAYGQTEVTVRKGKTAKWSVDKDFRATPNTLCVLRGAG